MGGHDQQYELTETGMPELGPYDGSRSNWKPTVDEDASALRMLEMVVAAIGGNAK
jgi:hypothetical protein